jgi:hypothetical protein
VWAAFVVLCLRPSMASHNFRCVHATCCPLLLPADCVSLHAHTPAHDSNTGNRMDEEVHCLYVAASRAKRELYYPRGHWDFCRQREPLPIGFTTVPPPPELAAALPPPVAEAHGVCGVSSEWLAACLPSLLHSPLVTQSHHHTLINNSSPPTPPPPAPSHTRTAIPRP